MRAFYSKLYLLTVPVFFVADMLWLGLVARDWPLPIIVIDTLWGMALCALVASTAFLIGRQLRWSAERARCGGRVSRLGRAAHRR